MTKLQAALMRAPVTNAAMQMESHQSMRSAFIPKSMMSRMLAVILLAAFLPSMLVGWLGYTTVYNDSVENKMHDTGLVADIRHSQLIFALNGANSRAGQFIDINLARCNALFGQLTPQTESCLRSALIIFVEREKAAGATLHRPKAGDLAVGTLTVGSPDSWKLLPGQLAVFPPTENQSNRVYHIPVTDPKTQSRLVMTYPADLLQDIFVSHPALGHSGETFLADSNGFFVTKPRYESMEGHGMAISGIPMQTCLQQKNMEMLGLAYRAAPVIHGFRYIPETGGGCIMAQFDQQEAFAPLEALKQKLITIALSIGLLAVIAAIYLARQVTRPLNILNRAVGGIEDGSEIIEISERGPIEVTSLAHSFNLMLKRLSQVIGRLKHQEQQLRESEEHATLLLESVSNGIWGMDTAGNTTFINSAAARMLGYTPEELIGKPMHAMVHHSYPSGSHYPAEKCPVCLTLVDGKNRTVTDEVLWRKDGSNFPAEYSAHPICTDGRLIGVVVAFQDITERKLKDEFILKQASYDALTGLPNRVLFQDRLSQEIKKSDRMESPLALLFIDLDRFKEINDTLGHGKGDMLLVEAAWRINECVRKTDTVARLGGDEFTVILPQFGERLHLERIAQDINKALINAFDLGDEDIGYISTSIGIAIYPGDAQDMTSLLKHADQAMYIAKANGRNRFAYFTQSMQQEAQEKLLLSNDLRQALVHKELQVYYQPIVELASGRITKAEALVRWKHPKLGMVSPTAFIPLAEESGAILEIGKWVFQEAIANIERWHQQSGLIVQISVNVSPVQFNDESTHREWLNKLMELGLPEKCLTMEITEGLLIKNSPKVKKRLLEFRNSGIEVSIDDFGTGFSSLSYLKQFDIDYLKIDISFIRNLVEDENDRALTEAIVVMAHKLGLKTIAEGVETEGQRDMLLKFGCDYVQGYLYSRPIPANEFDALL